MLVASVYLMRELVLFLAHLWQVSVCIP